MYYFRYTILLLQPPASQPIKNYFLFSFTFSFLMPRARIAVISRIIDTCLKHVLCKNKTKIYCKKFKVSQIWQTHLLWLLCLFQHKEICRKKFQFFIGKNGGTLVCHLLQDLKVPGSNLYKDKKIIELEMMRDLWDLKYTPYSLCC